MASERPQRSHLNFDLNSVASITSNAMVLWPLTGLFRKWFISGDRRTNTHVPPVDLLDAGKKKKL